MESCEQRITDLEKLVAQRTAFLEREIELRFRLAEEAISKSETVINERLASMNEFRNALKDQTARLVTREEYDTQAVFLREAVDKAEKIIAERMTTMNSLRDAVSERVRRLEDVGSQNLGRNNLAVWLMGMVIIAIQIGLHFLERK